jgi:hypothetical protein
MHPELTAAKGLLLANTRDLAFFIDIHSHSAATNAFMYANSVEIETPFDVPPQSAPSVPQGRGSWHPDHPANPARVLGPDCDGAASVARWEHESRFPRLLGARSRTFSFLQTRFNSDPSKEGTARRELGCLLGFPTHVYTLETSNYATRSPGESACAALTPARYMELGRDLALTFLDYYAETGPAEADPAEVGRAAAR